MRVVVQGCVSPAIAAGRTTRAASHARECIGDRWPDGRMGGWPRWATCAKRRPRCEASDNRRWPRCEPHRSSDCRSERPVRRHRSVLPESQREPCAATGEALRDELAPW